MAPCHLSDNARTTAVVTAMVRAYTTASSLWAFRRPPSHEITDSAAGTISWECYLKFEFPSFVLSAGYVRVDSAFNSVERLFAAEVGRIDGVEELYIRKDRDFYRMWTVLNEADVTIEDKVYDAQLRLMDQLDLPCDFSVIFRGGKDPASVRPGGAHRLYP